MKLLLLLMLYVPFAEATLEKEIERAIFSYETPREIRRKINLLTIKVVGGKTNMAVLGFAYRLVEQQSIKFRVNILQTKLESKITKDSAEINFTKDF